MILIFVAVFFSVFSRYQNIIFLWILVMWNVVEWDVVTCTMITVTQKLKMVMMTLREDTEDRSMITTEPSSPSECPRLWIICSMSQDMIQSSGKCQLYWNVVFIPLSLFRPDFEGDPTIVDVNIYVRSMGQVDEAKSIFSLDIYFRQYWTDDRLRFNRSQGVERVEELVLNWQFLSWIWRPDTYFVNGQESYLHKVAVPNRFIRWHWLFKSSLSCLPQNITRGSSLLLSEVDSVCPV